MTPPEAKPERGDAAPAEGGATVLARAARWTEAERLAALRRYAILDTPREAAFDELARLAADLLGASIGVINLVADDRQWFKAETGLGVRETPLDVSICRHALLREEGMVVPDLAQDERFRDNPLVTAAEGLRFYAGAVLRTPEGLPLGTICVLDTAPRPQGIAERERRALATLASQVMAQLELRRSEALARREGARAARHARRVELLAQAAEGLLAAPDAPAMLEGVFALLAPEFRLEALIGFACGPDGFAPIAVCGLSPERARLASEAAFAETLCALAADTRRAVHVTDIQRSEEPRAAVVRAMGLDAYYSVPLLAGEALLGTVSFGRRGRGFSPGERHALSAVAGHVATALRRLRADGERAVLAQAVEQSSDLIGLADPSGRAFYLNEAGRRMVGLGDAEAVSGARLADFVAPEDWGPLKALIRSARDERGGWAGPVRFRHFETGAAVPVDLSHFEIRDARGAPVAMAVVARDTAERDRLVEARRESEARFRTLFESAGVGLALLDGQGVVLDANPAFAAIAGRDPGALAGDSLLAPMDPADAARARPRLDALASGAERAAVFEARFPGLGRRPIQARLAVTRLDGRLLLAVAEDATARAEAEAAREASEARLAAIFEQAPAGLCEIAEDGRFVRVNDALCALLARGPEALSDARVAEVAHPEDLPLAEAAMAEVAATGAPRTVELRGVRPDGSAVWVSARLSRLNDEAGGATSLLAVVVDIGERVRATLALARRSRQLGELAETALAVARADGLEATLEAVTVAARRVVGAHQGVVSLTRGRDWSQSINTVALTDKYDAWRGYEGAPDGSGVYAWVCEQGRPARLTQAELEAHPRWRGFGPHAAEHPPLRGWLAVPLTGRDGRNLGLIQLSDKEDGGEFDAADEAMLVQLAQLASAAVEQTEAAAALRDSEARLRAAVLASPFPTMLHAEDGEVLELSRKWCELTGYRREQIPTHFAWGRLAYPDLADFGERLAAEFHREGETAAGEWPVRAADGRTLVWDFRNVALGRLPDGRRLQISAAADVTARRAAEEALRDKAMEFEALADNVSQLAWMAEPDGHIFWYNKRWYDYTGTSLETMRGWGWRTVHHPDHVERVLEEVRANWARGEPWEGTFLLRSASGEFRPFLTRAEPIRDGEGRLVRWFGTNTDVAEILALRETGERYRAIVESAREFAIFTLDPGGVVTSWNIGAARLFGHEQEDAVGRLGHMIFTPEDRAAGVPEIEMRRAAEAGQAEDERFHVRADGSRFWASGWMMLLRAGPDGEQVGFLKILQDRTERRRAEEHQRLMVNELNHRVKNSLATVQAIAQQTLLNSDGVEPARRAIARRLQALADAHDVLTRESWEGASLADVVEAALRPFAAESRARFEVGGPPVRLAPRLALSLNLALHELCTNAAKYGALSVPGGVVSIRWTCEAEDGPGAEGGRRLRLAWRERGGPPIEAPPRRVGFGARLVRMALAAEREGRVAMSFERGGLVCDFEAVLE